MTTQKDLFFHLLECERKLSEADTKLANVMDIFGALRNQAESAKEQAWAALEASMKETGEYELLIEGGNEDYKVNYNVQREKVKIADLAAVPDEFCKIERKPMLKEIAEHIKKAPTNWAMMERGEPKLQWKLLKKGKSNA